MEFCKKVAWSSQPSSTSHTKPGLTTSRKKQGKSPPIPVLLNAHISTHTYIYIYIYIHTGLSCRGRTDTVHAETELPSAETSSLLKLLSSTCGDGQYVTLHGSPSARNIILQPLSYVCPAAGSFHFISPKPSSNTKRWMTTNGMPHLPVRF